MSQPITIALTGDVMLGRMVNETIFAEGFAYPWGNVLPLLKRAGLLCINLECALTAHAARGRDGGFKPFHFRADPSVVRTLQAAGVDCASLANNHSLDFGAEGLLETIAVLDRAGIEHVGAGANRAAAEAAAVFEVRGTRIGILGCADYPREWTAGEDAPGINYTPVALEAERFERVQQLIATARAACDLLVFCIHWGPNMRDRPTASFQRFARAVLDAGADIFWGHSAHVVQGAEVREGKLILYDAGDFVDDYAIDPELRNDLSALFLIELRPPGVERVTVMPVKIDNMQVNLAEGADREWFVRRFRRLCDEMGTSTERVEEGLRIPVTELTGVQP
jgi:poly-gamma-glutamate synthesis protein (capsule biosynthesis protein)